MVGLYWGFSSCSIFSFLYLLLFLEEAVHVGFCWGCTSSSFLNVRLCCCGWMQVNVPKTKKSFCKGKDCKKHTLHKVTQYKKGKDSLYVQGAWIYLSSLLALQCTEHITFLTCSRVWVCNRNSTKTIDGERKKKKKKKKPVYTISRKNSPASEERGRRNHLSPSVEEVRRHLYSHSEVGYFNFFLIFFTASKAHIEGLVVHLWPWSSLSVPHGNHGEDSLTSSWSMSRLLLLRLKFETVFFTDTPLRDWCFFLLVFDELWFHPEWIFWVKVCGVSGNTKSGGHVLWAHKMLNMNDCLDAQQTTAFHAICKCWHSLHFRIFTCSLCLILCLSRSLSKFSGVLYCR